MLKFSIVGMGPGHEDYIVPRAKKTLESAQVIIGGKRHLQPFLDRGKILIPVEGQLKMLPEIIRVQRKKNKIAVAVSGDTGFYSLLSYLKKHFSENEFEVIPGISSLQYMYAAVGKNHQNGFLGSVHGRHVNYTELLDKYETVGLLTDNKQTPQEIARRLVESGWGHSHMYVGENLSYDDECITVGKAKDLLNKIFSTLSVVILQVNRE